MRRIAASCALLMLMGLTGPVGAQVNAPAPGSLPAIVWADRVASYTPGAGLSGSGLAAQDADRVLGVPDCAEGSTTVTCGLDQSSGPRGMLSLGNGGSVAIRFTDNVLVGDGDEATPDLFVYEVGPSDEATRLTILTSSGQEVQLFDPSGSTQCGNDPTATGEDATTLEGDVSGVDIDCWVSSFNDLPERTEFTGVIVEDVASKQQSSSSSTPGADIDGIGASAAATTPPSDQTPGSRPGRPAASIADVNTLPTAVRLAGDYTAAGEGRYRILRLGRQRYRGVVVTPPNDCYEPRDTVWRIQSWDSATGRGTGSVNAQTPPMCGADPIADVTFELRVAADGRQRLTICATADNCLEVRRLAHRLITVDGEDKGTSSALAAQLLIDLLTSGDTPEVRQAAEERLVYAVTNQAFADALSVAGVTGANHGVMVELDPEDPAANDETLSALDPARVVIVGGQQALPDSAFTLDVTRERIGGDNRFDTAANVSRSTYQPGVPRAYIATGANFPDALSGGAQASLLQAPVLLVDGARMPEETASELGRLQPQELHVLGGTAVIPESMVTSLQDYAPEVIRVAGPSRVDTAIEVSKSSYPSGADVAYMASGDDFGNALLASANAWVLGGPLLLVGENSLPGATAEELQRLDPDQVVLLSDAFELEPMVRTDLVDLVDALG